MLIKISKEEKTLTNEDNKKSIYVDDDFLREVSKLYYEENYTQDEIAKKMFISRTNISRYLKEARRREIVEIKINYPFEKNVSLGEKLCEAFNLKSAYVTSAINPLASEEYLYVCQMAAKAFDLEVNEDTVYGISRGRTTKTVVKNLKPRRTLQEMCGVQLCGSLIENDDPAEFEEIDLIRGIQEKYLCHSYCSAMPGIVDNKKLKELIIQESSTQRLIRKANELTFLLLSSTTVDQWNSFLDDEEISKLKKQGAVGNILGYFYDKDGIIIENKIYERLMIPNRSVFNAPNRMIVAAETFKNYPIYVALKSGLANSVVTSERIANKLLRLNQERN